MWRISSDIEDCCIERRLFVQLAGNLIFTEETFNFVRPQRCSRHAANSVPSA
jgi:hypothetical protein